VEAEVRRNAGFTLIEILIVVLVIGILAAIAIPNYYGMQNRARESRVQSSVHVVHLIVENFLIENGNYPANAAALLAGLFSGGVYPENPFTGTNDAIIAADGWDAGDEGKVGYAVVGGIYTIEAYGKTAVVLTLTNG